MNWIFIISIFIIVIGIISLFFPIIWDAIGQDPISQGIKNAFYSVGVIGIVIGLIFLFISFYIRRMDKKEINRGEIVNEEEKINGRGEIVNERGEIVNERGEIVNKEELKNKLANFTYEEASVYIYKNKLSDERAQEYFGKNNNFTYTMNRTIYDMLEFVSELSITDDENIVNSYTKKLKN